MKYIISLLSTVLFLQCNPQGSSTQPGILALAAGGSSATTDSPSTTSEGNNTSVEYHQDGNWNDLLIFGARGWDGIHDVQTDSAGNVYLSGGTYGNLDGEQNPFYASGSPTIASHFVAKYSVSGERVWTRLSGFSSESPGDTGGWTSLAVSTDAIYLAGSRSDFPGQTSIRGFLARYDSAGNQVWISPPTNVLARVTALQKDGNVLLLGHDYVPQTQVVLSSFGPNGSLNWAVVFPETPLDAYGLATDSAGNIYVSAVQNQTKSIVRSFTSSGTLRWNRDLTPSGGITDIRSGFLKVDSDGNVFVSIRQLAAGAYTWKIASFTSTGSDRWATTVPNVDGGAGSLRIARGSGNSIFANGYSNTGSTMLLSEFNATSGAFVKQTSYLNVGIFGSHAVAADCRGVYVSGLVLSAQQGVPVLPEYATDIYLKRFSPSQNCQTQNPCNSLECH